LLCARAKRPASYPTAEQRDEVASLHCVLTMPNSTFNSVHQNRKIRQAKLAGGAAMCAAKIPGGLCPVGVNSTHYRSATLRSAVPQSADINYLRKRWPNRLPSVYATVAIGAPPPFICASRGPIARNWAPFPISNSYCRRAGTPASPPPIGPAVPRRAPGPSFSFCDPRPRSRQTPRATEKPAD
jgi:hypothetical protein